MFVANQISPRRVASAGEGAESLLTSSASEQMAQRSIEGLS
jgi:hypothetical protein